QDVDLARTAVLLPQGVYDARWRDFSTSIDGGVLFGNFSLGNAGSLSYEAFAGVTNLDKDEGGVSRWIVDRTNGGEVTSFDQPLMIGGQLWWQTPLDGLRLGANLAQMYDFGFHARVPVSPMGPFGPINAFTTGAGDVFFQQYSAEYMWNSWTFQAEYLTYEFEGATTTNVRSGSTPIQPTARAPLLVRPDAWYVSAAYRFNHWLEVGTYYTEHYADRENRDGGPDAAQKDLALSFRFDPTDWWILKLEGHYLRGTSLLQDAQNNPVADRTNDPWFMLALKTTFSF
ncbi:MAG TPA: hypothetical protein DCY13_03025, partial [Verrucomicrobiales bacterium]|nr:hypothetical protein [Verrucomicrobiales bacterium]